MKLYASMKFAISLIASVVLLSGLSSDQPMRERVLRQAALEAGLLPPAALNPEVAPELAALGKRLFESNLISLNAEISCSSCHLDQFGSADGLPVAIGVGGHGEGAERLNSGGAIVPRNALALWGRGGVGFDTLFWDGRVQRMEHGEIVSQFGPLAPSDDPLIVAAHLPVVQIREMVIDDADTEEALQQESVYAANLVFEEIAERVAQDPDLGPEIRAVFEVETDAVEFLMIAQAIAAFIRDEFALQETAFTRFVFEEQRLLSELQVQGGLIFYGKGRCASCHAGPYFTDFEFHAVPIPQRSFGMNGFGIDFGRYNSTRDPDDIHRFRTPPLWNVARTGPFGHSGGADSLEHAVRYHFDPLAEIDPAAMSARDRTEYYSRLRAWAQARSEPAFLDEDELAAVTSFLDALSFEDDCSEDCARN